MTQEQKPNRCKLTVTTIDPQKPVGDKGAVKLPFKAKDQDGKELAYFTFSKSLFDFIKPEAVIDADIEITTRETETATYTDRKIVQIYQNGQPISQKKQWQGSGHDSPEQRKSIEGIAALHELGEMIRANVSIAPQRVKAYWDIVDKSLYEWRGIVITLEPVIPPVTPTATKKEGKTPPRPKESQVEASKTETPPDNIKPETLNAINAWEKRHPELKSAIESYNATNFKRLKTADLTETEGQQLLNALILNALKEGGQVIK